jgi:hypothetical protein
MAGREQSDLVMKLVCGFRLSSAEQRVRDVTIPLSAIIGVAGSSLETSVFFPPDVRPEELGDGAVIEWRDKHRYIVHERFEIGQMRFSEIRSRSCFTLRGAVRRYLKHYRSWLAVDRVRILRWR